MPISAKWAVTFVFYDENLSWIYECSHTCHIHFNSVFLFVCSNEHKVWSSSLRKFLHLTVISLLVGPGFKEGVRLTVLFSYQLQQSCNQSPNLLRPYGMPSSYFTGVTNVEDNSIKEINDDSRKLAIILGHYSGTRKLNWTRRDRK
jgi:hypothetical protein